MKHDKNRNFDDNHINWSRIDTDANIIIIVGKSVSVEACALRSVFVTANFNSTCRQHVNIIVHVILDQNQTEKKQNGIALDIVVIYVIIVSMMN